MLLSTLAGCGGVSEAGLGTAAADGSSPEAATAADGPATPDTRADASAPDAVPPPGSAWPTSACARADRLAPGDYDQARWPLRQTASDGTVVSRSFMVHVPPVHASGDALPLVLNLHPATSLAFMQALMSGMNGKADAAGFVAVHPESLGLPLTLSKSWGTGHPASISGADRIGVSDAAFLRALLDDLSDDVCFDRRRVYATGYSSGAGMSAHLACEAASGRLGDWRLAAIAPVSGTPPVASAADITTCPALAADPVPILMIFSDNDLTIRNLFLLPDTATVTALARRIFHDWAMRNGCDGSTSTHTGVDAYGAVMETVTARCDSSRGHRADSILTLFGVGSADKATKDGHIWPGDWFGTPFKATDAIWSFFAAHPR